VQTQCHDDGTNITNWVSNC